MGSDNVFYLFDHDKSDEACTRTFLIQILQESEIPDPEGATLRILQHTNGAVYPSLQYVNMLARWKEEGLDDLLPLFWAYLKEKS